MSDLSGLRHSGGERAVSTIMYLMALQEFTSAPFRVVDEINQGMDERNERLAFDRIVQSCCSVEENGDPKPQYFLVSPKLLQGLRAMDNPDVTVLLVWNGPGVRDTWQLSSVLQAMKIKRKKDYTMVIEQKKDHAETIDDHDDVIKVVNKKTRKDQMASDMENDSDVIKVVNKKTRKDQMASDMESDSDVIKVVKPEKH
eukprot:gene56977-76078_t